MSDPTTTNTNGVCELVLDYVYGELDEARKRTFDEHLPTCARCQQEVASFGRVRTAVQRVMPAVEPSAPLGGALHAQLMHAAAQRQPRRGVLLAFPRKIVEHPALSAAAMFVLVGGAIAINWSRGKMTMPAAAPEAVEAAKPSEVAAAQTELAKTGAAPATPAAEPMPQAKAKKEEGGPLGAFGSSGAKGGSAAVDDSTQMVLEAPSGKSYTVVQRPAAHRAATAAPKKEAPARLKNIASDGNAPKYDNALDQSLGAKDRAGAAGEDALADDVVGGSIGGGGRSAPAAEGGKSSTAPGSLSRTTVAEKAPARADKQQTHGYSAGAPATMPEAAAPPPPAPVAATSTPSSSERDHSGWYRSQSQTTVAKPSSSTRSVDGLRRQANELAKSGRCDEAIKLYQELEKSAQYISPSERVNWVRCLTQRGRQEEAQQRLDELKAEKRVTNAQIQEAEKELVDSRARRLESKKAKKAAPADRAPAATVREQQRAADQPAQAPPDSTNTKVQKPTSAY